MWHALFTHLGFRVEVSGLSSRRIYEKGQFSIPSDTACYPAKIMHGHMEVLLERGVDAIFYPCLTYNVDEGESDNHYNCPVVAYYSELLHGNMDDLSRTNFLYPFLNINDRRELTKELTASLRAVFPSVTEKEVRQAVDHAFDAYAAHMTQVRRQGEEAVRWARAHGRPIMILAGRPYHIDPEIGHGIDKLAASLGFVVVSEDSVCHMADPQPVHVLNQWTYHARLYRAARFACENPDVQLVQLVSFGCGVDAITTDEVREILEEEHKIYTQIKIDEITNLGAVKIRLRSLIGALEEKERRQKQARREEVRRELASWFGDTFEHLEIAGTFNLILNAANMVRNHVGAALGFFMGNLSDELCFVPLSPPLETGTVLVWKKDQAFSPAASAFLEALKHTQ